VTVARTEPGPAAGAADEPGPLPPVMQLGIVALALVVVAGIYLAATAARNPNLAVPVVLVCAAAVLVAVAAVALARVKRFAWAKFRMVFGWALLEYAVIAGMLIYVFTYDHTPARIEALFIAALVLFAVDIPMMFAFSVARFQPVPRAG
jgi:hypothetical protein